MERVVAWTEAVEDQDVCIRATACRADSARALRRVSPAERQAAQRLAARLVSPRG
jgi:hypothetical protein